MNEELVEQIKNSVCFEGWKKYILSEIEKLDTVSGLNNLTDEDAGQEAKVRLKTTRKLKEILFPFIELPRPTFNKEEVRRKAEEKAGF